MIAKLIFHGPNRDTAFARSGSGTSADPALPASHEPGLPDTDLPASFLRKAGFQPISLKPRTDDLKVDPTYPQSTRRSRLAH